MRRATFFPLALVLSLALTAALVLAACGDDDGDGAADLITEAPAASASPVAAPPQPSPAQAIDATLTEPVGGVIQVSLANLSFSPNNLHVPLGESVTIRLTNDDSTSHTMRVAGIDGQYDTEDDAVVKVINPGESSELDYSGGMAGTYTFRCDLHPGQMGGVIVVD
jgi:plastocyanin